MTTGAFIAAMAAKFNIDTSVPAFADALALGAEIPDPVAQLFTTNNSLLSLDAARNNPELKRLFKAEALNTMDKTIETLMSEHELPEDFIAEIKANNNTYTKVPALVKKIRDLEAAKATASGSDKSVLTAQINALNQKLAEAQNSMTAALQQKESEHANIMSEMLKQTTINGKKLSTSTYPIETVRMFAKQLVEMEAEKRGIKIKNINGTLQLKQAAEETLDYYENNALVTFDSFVDQVLANNKLLAVTDQPPAPGTTPGFPPPPPTTPGQRTVVPLSGMSSKLDRALADFNGPARIV